MADLQTKVRLDLVGIRNLYTIGCTNGTYPALAKALMDCVEQAAALVTKLQDDLAECYRLTGADPDGNENWRLAKDAVEEVRRFRKEFDEMEKTCVAKEPPECDHDYKKEAEPVPGYPSSFTTVDRCTKCQRVRPLSCQHQMEAVGPANAFGQWHGRCKLCGWPDK